MICFQYGVSLQGSCTSTVLDPTTKNRLEHDSSDLMSELIQLWIFNLMVWLGGSGRGRACLEEVGPIKECDMKNILSLAWFLAVFVSPFWNSQSELFYSSTCLLPWCVSLMMVPESVDPKDYGLNPQTPWEAKEIFPHFELHFSSCNLPSW